MDATNQARPFDRAGSDVQSVWNKHRGSPTSMTDVAPFSTPSSGLRFRLPLALLLTLGLLVSLIHCAGCDLNFAPGTGPTVAVSHDQGSVPDAPEQALPCHSGHCLSHVATQRPLAVALPADPRPHAHRLRQEPFPTVLAGLPLFKPPRA